MINPLGDDSRWTVIGSRFETPQFLKDEMARMMDEFVASLPEDSPALELHRRLSGMSAEDFLSQESAVDDE